MALYKHDRKILFSEIRLVLSVEGFYINETFVLKELGFKSKDLCGTVYFKTECNQLNQKDRKTTAFLSNFIHGLNYYKNNEHWVSSNDFSAVIKTLYQLTEDGHDLSKKYIGYSNDLNLLTLLHKSGFSTVSVNLKEIFDDIPTIKSIKSLPAYGFGTYRPCHMHQSINDFKYQCAKVKSLILYEWCLNKLQNSEIKNGFN
jgi:hypothetical protein